MEIIFTHQNADFDAVASMLAAHKLYPQAQPVLPASQHASVREFITLYKNGLPFIAWDDFDADQPIHRLILTDTQHRPRLKQLPDDVPTLIIEHHPQERELGDHETWMGDEIGAATTILVEQLEAAGVSITSLEATLMALGIYVDTGMLTYRRTSPRDIRAAAWLLEQNADLDTVRRFSSHPLNDAQQILFEKLLDDTHTRTIHGYDICICHTRSDQHISGISSVTERLKDILDTDAVFVVVKMPEHIQLVCRSAEDAIHVGEVAQEFGGGGHPRASAAAIHTLDDHSVIEQIWNYLEIHVHPATTIRDIMSHGDIQTVNAHETIEDLVPRLRRIGHEGYPVMEEGDIIGLLTLRDADKALEHGLSGATARTIMQGGKVTLQPDDSVATLEETMVESDWGQIPIVADDGTLVGIVTRTDLIKHWAQTHPSTDTTADESHNLDPQTAAGILGDETIELIQHIADQAQQQDKALYMVGGVVRDLLLRRRNFDIDFVVGENAIAFAEHLRDTFGGTLHTYAPFGTAKWQINLDVAKTLNLPLDSIPGHIDFATARSELYEHPTALPTVYSSSIKLDLRRRDFTINALAVQLSPARQQWHILDFYGGLSDLDAGIIRVLHSLSFIDDPTRILRAVRFSERLDFTIEERTKELIKSALPMLHRISGERIKNELSLLLQEEHPEHSLLRLQTMDVLAHIHPQWEIMPDIVPVFMQERDSYSQFHPQWISDDDRVLLRWNLILAALSPNNAESVAERLRFKQQEIATLRETAELVHAPGTIAEPDAAPSTIDSRLQSVDDISLLAAWLWFYDNPTIRQHIETYHDDWQHIQPQADGNTLKEMGLPPGPRYSEILADLRAAWLDGDITSPEEERAYLQQQLAQEQNDESASG